MATLSLRARGPEVESQQKRLHELGYVHVMPDGIFGPATQAAVGDLQHRHGLDATGRVGARLAALIASPDVLPAPSRPPDGIDIDEIRGQFPYVTAVLDWLEGERFTERADEPERRAAVGRLAPDELRLAGLTRIAAGAILALPDDHPERAYA